MQSRNLQTFWNTDTQKVTEKFSKIYREMVFKDCKVQNIVSFLLRFQGGHTKIVKSCGTLVSGVYFSHTNPRHACFPAHIYIYVTIGIHVSHQ